MYLWRVDNCSTKPTYRGLSAVSRDRRDPADKPRYVGSLIKYILLLVLFSNSYASIIGLGIGGGGSLAGISFDPVNPAHFFVGTDMGLVYETFDLGEHWTAISQSKISFNVDLKNQSHMGFGNQGELYWASGGCNPQMSLDRGKTWMPLKTLAAMLPDNCMAGNTRIIYWFFPSDNTKIIGVGTSSGLLISVDAGITWTRLFTDQKSLASMFTDQFTLYHASEKNILKYNLKIGQGETLLSTPLSAAAMGKDSKGLTIAGVENTNSVQKKMFIKKATEEVFAQQTQPVGSFIRMSINNSSMIYFTGNDSVKDGSAIWMSENGGDDWVQIYTDDESAYRAGKINPNPVGLYVGFWDNGYYDFQVAPSNPNLIAGGGNFFFKVSTNKGSDWKFPYAKLNSPTDKLSKSDFWTSTALNPISVFFLKQNPTNKNMIVAGVADIGCVLSQDDGNSWRMCNIPKMNSIYDVAFNPKKPNQLYAAASTMHDYPEDWFGDIQNEVPGGIFISDDAGISWQRLSPDTKEFQNPYLSIAIDFDQSPCHIYAGTQGKGISASLDCGENWQWLNKGFESQNTSTNSSEQNGALIFPSIKISPLTGDVYALHAGNRLWQKAENPYLHYTGLYKLNKSTNTWVQLGRPPLIQGAGAGAGLSNLYWKYPLDFAVDWSNPKQLYLVDTSTAGTWKITGLWSSSDEGKTWQQVLQFSSARKVILKDNKVCVVGWSDPDEPFLYCSIDKAKFEPIKLDLPLHRVNDILFEDKGILFATFGGGLFKWDLQGI